MPREQHREPGAVTAPVEIRTMRAGEASVVGALTLAAYDASGVRMEGEYRRWLAAPQRRRDRVSALLVAVDAGVVVGTVTFVTAQDPEFEHRPRDGDCGFRMLAVAPNAWGRGVGSALLDDCVARARTAGCRRMVITSMEWMTRAHTLYRQHGFQRRPDLDVRYPSGVGWGFAFDLVPDAERFFATPRPVPSEPPWYENGRR